jgi:hypothetical protein
MEVMRLVFGWLLIFLLTAVTVLSQVDERIPPEPEKKEAQRLASAAMNDLLESRDLRPLINKYFIDDFSKRLQFCGETGKCGGFAKDFWQKNDELVSLKGTRADYQRTYINAINSWFLYLQAQVDLAHLRNKKILELNEVEEKEVVQQLRSRIIKKLGKNSGLLKLSWFENPDAPPPKVKSLKEYRALEAKYEELNSALRLVEKTLRKQLAHSDPHSVRLLTPNDFRIYKEPVERTFFNFSPEIQIYQAWSDLDSGMFVIDMIREKGKLKIVAFYPPID